MLVEEVFAPGQLPIVEHNTELKVPTGFAEPSPDVFDVHSLVVPSSQDTEVRARGGEGNLSTSQGCLLRRCVLPVRDVPSN